MRASRYVVSVLCGAAIGACTSDTFFCADDSECVDAGGGAGMCGGDNVCSFPDDDCASGQRYGAHSGAVSGMCVPPGGTTGESTGTAEASEAASGPATTISSSTSEATTTLPLDTTAGSSSSTSDTGADPDLVLHFEFEGGLEGTVVDASGNALDGNCTVETCPVSVPGPVGNAARFDGTDDFVSVPDDPLFRIQSALTISLWLNLDELTPSQSVAPLSKIVGVENENSWQFFIVSTASSAIVIEANTLGPVQNLSAAAAADVLGPLQWRHVAMTVDGATLTLWLDAQPVATAMDPDHVLVYDDGDLLIGTDMDFGVVEHFLPGAIDDLRIYKRTLTQEELQALVDAGDIPG